MRTKSLDTFFSGRDKLAEELSNADLKRDKLDTLNAEIAELVTPELIEKAEKELKALRGRAEKKAKTIIRMKAERARLDEAAKNAETESGQSVEVETE